MNARYKGAPDRNRNAHRKPPPRIAPRATTGSTRRRLCGEKARCEKILVVGDFIGNGLAEGLDIAFASDPDLKVVSRVNGSSGFVRDDHFDWPENIGGIVDEEKPDTVVVMIGANDRQAITIKGTGLPLRSPEWNEEYQKRVAAFVKSIGDKHVPFVWIGQPPFRPRGMSQDMLALNEFYRGATEKRAVNLPTYGTGSSMKTETLPKPALILMARLPACAAMTASI